VLRLTIFRITLIKLKKENKDFCEKIAAKDYEYFINNQNYDSTNKFEDLINTIKDLFIQLTESNKESIFLYLNQCYF
jgi:hypothetical protein